VPQTTTVDIFAGNNQPLAPSGYVPIGDPNAVLGGFYTQQPAAFQAAPLQQPVS